MARFLLRITVVAVVAALVTTGVMRWLVGDVDPAVTGGIVGGVTGAVAASFGGPKKTE